ncbi:hypothetical protein UCDDS831_g05166 [Diplodia seriata]|uniref:Uncharacterized protein n=1 Tax=Diplodia seriata TaxID=420778 RepID=A0A0G2EC99_9PEZI|nr:hypothetical protein UCDDS831_g05166 [Diplodia seriata]
MPDSSGQELPKFFEELNQKLGYLQEAVKRVERGVSKDQADKKIKIANAAAELAQEMAAKEEEAAEELNAKFLKEKAAKEEELAKELAAKFAKELAVREADFAKEKAAKEAEFRDWCQRL